jgi:chloramphenicol 3-O-phosphotransferase
MENEYDPHPDFGITPAQYHHGLSKLWDALNMPSNPTGEDVFTLAARAIEESQQKPSRREIAAMAMQGLLATPGEYEHAKTIAQWAVDQADALIERLNADPVAEGVDNGK